jgi:opacity protein-like surface antigen
MLRLPLLTSERIPQGLVQPYAAIGPGVFFSTAGLEVAGAEDFQGSTVDAGLDARLGVEVQFLRWLGVFIEYRHTRFSPTWRDSVADTPVSLSTDLDSDHIQLGTAFHF